MNLELNIENKKWKYTKTQHEIHKDGVHYIFKFGNGYGASVIKNPCSYGSDEDLWELAVLKDGGIHYENPVAQGDVRGWLTDKEVNELLRQIEKF